MAFSGNEIVNVRTGGSDSNGGGFRAGASGTDRSLQDAAHATLSVASTVTATTTIVQVNAGDYTVLASDVGNILQITGGTATAGFFVITAADTTNNRWTLDRSAGTNTQTIVGKMGGALASPGKAASAPLVSGNKIAIKSGTYTVASASTNIATGCISLSVTNITIEGYGTTPGDFGTPPLLQASGISTFTLISASVAGGAIRNLDLDGASLTSSRGLLIRGTAYRVKALNCTGNGIATASSSGMVVQCRATGCSTATAFSSGGPSAFIDCIAYENTITGFTLSIGTSAIRCISDSNSGASSDGFASGSADAAFVNCVAYGNGRDGFRSTVNTPSWVNCIAEGNTGVGFTASATQSAALLVNNAAYSNTGGNTSLTGATATIFNTGFQTLTGSPFTDAANQDFSLNNTASAGAACRAAGFPGVLAVGGTGYLDIGALQHADPAGSGTTIAGTPMLRGMVG